MNNYVRALRLALRYRATIVTIFITALAAINIRGIVQGAMATNVLTVGKGLPLILLAAAGLWLGDWTIGPLEGLPSLGGLSGAVIIAFWACMGFEVAAVIAGEAKDPGRDLPVGLLGGVLGAGRLYVLLLLACFRTVPDLANSVRPLSDAAEAHRLLEERRIFGKVVLTPGAKVGADDLTQWVSERLAYYKVPAHWEIRNEPLPRNAAGKVLKNVLSGEADA